MLASIDNYEERLKQFKAQREAYEKSAREAAEQGGELRLKRRESVRIEGGGGNSQTTTDKSDDERAAEAFSDAINEALRKPLEGETRVRATLVRIECVPRGLVFVFKAGDRTLRLASADFKGLHIVAYTPDAEGELSCGARKSETHAVVTFRPGPEARAKTDGALVALEFVPADFRLKQ